MPVIKFDSVSYSCEKGESVLDALTRHGVSIPHSCKSGLCQTCLMRSESGKPPEASQKGLKPNQQEQNYFLACSCVPQEDMSVVLPDAQGSERHSVVVLQKEMLCDSVIGLRLQKPDGFEYRSGQFVNLYKSDEVVRSYSLASQPQDDFLELHVREIAGGEVSSWLKASVHQGDELVIGGALGTSFYMNDAPEKNLLLIGTGTGLAPLYGIARDAISKGHQGNIWLYHGAAHASDLYLHEKLQQLEKMNSKFHYVACVSQEDAPEGGHRGRASAVALQQHKDLKGWRVYLCGNPDMVEATRKATFLAGANFSDIFTDPFKFASN